MAMRYTPQYPTTWSGVWCGGIKQTTLPQMPPVLHPSSIGQAPIKVNDPQVNRMKRLVLIRHWLPGLLNNGFGYEVPYNEFKPVLKWAYLYDGQDLSLSRVIKSIACDNHHHPGIAPILKAANVFRL